MPKTKLFVLLIPFLLLLSACDSEPAKQLQSIAKDITTEKYPVADMPDEPLDEPLDIIIEPKRVAMTSTWSAGVKDDGTLWTWGTGSLLRPTKTGQDPTPRPVEGINDAVAVSGGTGHMLLLRKDGTVWGWGSNYDGKIDPTDEDTSIDELRQIQGIDGVVDVIAGVSDSFFISKEGEVYALGLNEKGWINGLDNPIKKPVKVPNLKNIVRIEKQGNVLLALNNKGELYSTGIDWRSLGRKVKPPVDGIHFYPAKKVELPQKKVVDFFADGSNLGALLEDGSVWVWGVNSESRLAYSYDNHIKVPVKNSYLNKIKNIGVISALSEKDNIYIWGDLGFGKSRNSISIEEFNRPVRIAENIHVTQFIDGSLTLGFIDSKGWAWFWGRNDKAQRGTGQVIQTMNKEYMLVPEKSLFNIHQ